MQSEHEAEAQAGRDELKSETELVLAEVKALRNELKALDAKVSKIEKP